MEQAYALIDRMWPIIAGALAGGIVAEWRARAAESRADQRDLKRLKREQWLDAIAQTEQDYLAVNRFLVAKLLGDAEGMKAAKNGSGVFPRADIWLIRDINVIRSVMSFRGAMNRRAPGSVTAKEINLFGFHEAQVMSLLGAQRHRVLSGEPPVWPTLAEISAAQREFSGSMGFEPPGEWPPPYAGDYPP